MRNQLFVFIFSVVNVFSQTTERNHSSNSIEKMDYSELYQYFIRFSNNENDSLAGLYAESYLNKAKQNDDNKRIAEGYKYLGSLKEIDLNIKYLDSALRITKNSSFIGWYSAFIHYDKGIIYYRKRAFKEAIDNLLKSNSLARQFNFSELIFDSNYMIAILTDRIGNHKESIEIHNEYLEYSKNQKTIDTSLYLQSLFGIAVASYKIEKIEKADSLVKQGLKISNKIRNQNFYNHFLLCSSVISYHRKHYNKSIINIDKSIRYFTSVNDKPNLAVAFFYKGKTLYDSGSELASLNYFKKVDSIFNIQKDILPEIRGGYQILINHYKKSNDLTLQLIYTNRLMEVDSILDQNYKYLQKNIVKDYYTPLLIDESVKTKSRYFWSIIYITISLLVISISGLFYINYKKKLLKRKFELIILKNPTKKKKESLRKNKTNDINIPEEIITNIINGLKEFEAREQYVDNTYTLSLLASQLKTNSSYLSKTINVLKQKSFSTYINDLRIDYTIKNLQNNSKFDLYSIKGIAQEVGFKSSESFSKAFYKKTGIYPSYFIKKLKEKKS